MKRVLIIVLFVLFVNLIGASFEVGELSHLIGDSYGQSSFITGWVNMSFNSEPGDFIFETDLGDSISLIELLETNSNYNYSCIPEDCDADYSLSGAAQTKTFSLEAGESKVVGIKFSGDIVAINSVDFSLESDVASSCKNQLQVDLLNDNTVEISNTKVMNEGCSALKSYGCFDETKTLTEYRLTTNSYCGKIELSKSPGFNLGAWVKGDSAVLKMKLYNNLGTQLKECELENIPVEGGEVSCAVNYSVIEPEYYYVCIFGSGARVRGYADSEGCGFSGVPVSSGTADYQIFAEGKKFDSIGNLDINNSFSYEYTIAGLFNGYLQKKYGVDMECPVEGCVVPIKFIAEKSQTISLKNLFANYEQVSGFPEENEFYDLIESSVEISSDFQKLYLDGAKFSVPDIFGSSDFDLKFNGEGVFSEEIFVEKIASVQAVTPTTVAAAFPTEFSAITLEGGNISSYVWDFGDNKTETTTSNQVIHVYESIGNYKLKLTVTDLNQRSSSSVFDIIVESPVKAVNTTLEKKLSDLSNVKKQIEGFPVFQKNSLDAFLNLSKVNDELTDIQRLYATSTTDEQYVDLMQRLIKLDVPESIETSKSADAVSFYIDEDNINLEILKTIGGGSSNASQDKYIDAILNWNNDIDSKITFSEFSAKYENFEEPILRVFKLDIKGDFSEAYVVFSKLENLNFKADYGEQEESGYIYIGLESSNVIEFATTSDVDFVNLPLFVSPAISKLSTEGDILDIIEMSKWTIFVLILIFIVLFAVI
ncbi:PKD domain-containing protein, partial [Nanoarchaeota archaeon]